MNAALSVAFSRGRRDAFVVGVGVEVGVLTIVRCKRRIDGVRGHLISHVTLAVKVETLDPATTAFTTAFPNPHTYCNQIATAENPMSGPGKLENKENGGSR